MVRQRKIWLAVSSCKWQLAMGRVLLASPTCRMPGFLLHRGCLNGASPMHAASPRLKDTEQVKRYVTNSLYLLEAIACA